MTSSYTAYFAAFAVASVISGTVGFGAMLVFFAITSFFAPDLQILLLAASTAANIKTIYQLHLFWPHIRWDITRQILLLGVPFAILGSLMAQYVPADFFRHWRIYIALCFVEIF